MVADKEVFAVASEDNSGKLVWFFAGAAIGAAIALLYAPESGKVIRRKIATKASEQAEVLTGASKEWLDKGKDLFDKGRAIADEAAEMFERGKKMVQG
jgi:gas vesicle protein